MSKIAAICNQKGGVGKTTTSINLSCGLAMEGNRVLLVDLDPQAHSTIGLGIELGSYHSAIHDVLLKKKSIEDIVIKTKIDNLFLAPSHIRLDKAEQQLAPEIFREAFLHNSIKELDYNFIIIDCRPSLGTLTINALYASNLIVVPCEMGRYALEGFTDLMETIKVVKKEEAEKNQNLFRILLTKLDVRNKLTNDWVINQLDDFKQFIFKTAIRKNEAINQAHIVGEPVFLASPNSNGSEDYKKLCIEFLSLCH